MLSATKHLMRHSNITQSLMSTRNISSLMKNVSFLVKVDFLLFFPSQFQTFSFSRRF